MGGLVLIAGATGLAFVAYWAQRIAAAVVRIEQEQQRRRRDAVATYVKRLRPQPGDLFVVSVDGIISWEQRERIKVDIGRGLPEGCKVFIVEPPVHFEGLFASPMGATVG